MRSEDEVRRRPDTVSVNHSCPCGRQSVGGLLVEIRRFEPFPNAIEYMHPDGVCVWKRADMFGPWRHAHLPMRTA